MKELVEEIKRMNEILFKIHQENIHYEQINQMLDLMRSMDSNFEKMTWHQANIAEILHEKLND